MILIRVFVKTKCFCGSLLDIFEKPFAWQFARAAYFDCVSSNIFDVFESI